MALFKCLNCKRLSHAGIRGLFLTFVSGSHAATEFGLTKRFRTAFDPLSKTEGRRLLQVQVHDTYELDHATDTLRPLPPNVRGMLAISVR